MGKNKKSATILICCASAVLIMGIITSPKRYAPNSYVKLPNGDKALVIKQLNKDQLYVRSCALRFYDNSIFKNEHKVVNINTVTPL